MKAKEILEDINAVMTFIDAIIVGEKRDGTEALLKAAFGACLYRLNSVKKWVEENQLEIDNQPEKENQS